MNRIVSLATGTLVLVSPLASAGVVMDLVTTNMSGQETERSRVYAQSGKLRMEELDGDQSSASMIFLGDRFLYVDHREKSYVVMDEAALEQVSSQMDAAMAQMEAELAKLPPEQRAMVEQMMQGQMAGMGMQAAEPPPAPTVKAIGSGKWKSYDCRRFEVFEGGEKTEEICAADLADVEGSDAFIETFRSMAAYITKMSESMPMQSDGAANPGELMEEIGGFPVHTIEYEYGKAVRETSLDSLEEQDIDEDMFAPPAGYRRQDPFGQP